jgi:hypothetical protein
MNQTLASVMAAGGRAHMRGLRCTGPNWFFIGRSKLSYEIVRLPFFVVSYSFPSPARIS